MPAGADPGSDNDPGRPPPPPDLDQRIREIAYLMWEAAGHQHGFALDYWLAAEKDVLATLAATARALIGGDAEPSGRAPEAAPGPPADAPGASSPDRPPQPAADPRKPG
jgi:hypothetical protein